MRPAFPLLAALAAAPAVLAAASAHAGCTSGCRPCCTAPATHTVTVPGISVVPPTIHIQPQKIVGGVGGDFGAVIDVSVSSSASAEASASGYAASLAASIAQSSAYSAGSSSALATANSQAQNLLAASGGGGSFFSEGSSSGNIPNLVVVTGEAPAPPVCLERRAVARAVAIQAVCLDDKAVPHPASQVSPERDVAQGYAGELFRCLAGSHMQYVLADYAGEARFEHGQTVVCRKTESLWRAADGRLQCRPQAPARDCNERSLLRRYGAGIKVVASAAEQCVRWSGPVQSEAAASPAQAMALDGGVGG